MSYELLDAEGQPVTYLDLQTRGPWLEHGRQREEVFVARYGQVLGLAINPAKDTDVTAADLCRPDGRLADLKCCNTPLFDAPEPSISINLKDILRYRRAGYQGFDLVFWIHWLVRGIRRNGQTTEVPFVSNVWTLPLDALIAARHDYAIRWYRNRAAALETNPLLVQWLKRMEPTRLDTPEGTRAIRDERGNAACSYVIPIRTLRPASRELFPAPMDTEINWGFR